VTAPGRLAAEGTRVVLVDTAHYGDGSDLDDLPSMRDTVEALRAVLIRRCGLDEATVPPPLHDPASPAEIGEALRAQAAQATDVLLFYFCGHGLIGGDGQLYLASARTRRDDLANLAYAALSYPQVLATLAECRATNIVIVLDCCYAGRAATPAVGVSSVLAGPGVPAGGYVLAAVGPNTEAMAPPGEAHTAFGDALITLLRDGVLDGPRELRLTDVFRYLERACGDWGRPCSYAVGSASDLIVADNPRYRPPMVGPVALVVGGEHGAPYRGLAAYRQGDQELFFGRTALSAELARELARQLDEPGPLLVLGPSGAGKSSLLRAGLRPRLDAGLPGAPDTARWPKAVVTARAGDPMLALAEPLAALWGRDIEPTALALAQPDGLGTVARAIVARHAGADGSGNRLVLIIDQAEELFAAGTARDAREAFLAALKAATTSGPDDAPPPVLAVLALRADFYGRALTEPTLADALARKRTFDVTPMSTAELIEVIVRPAETAGYAVEPELVTRILADLDDADENTLPLLSHALLETWRRRDETAGVLTLRGYEAAGGVRGAVAYTATRAWSDDGDSADHLDAAERDLARSCLLHLVHLGDAGAEPARRRMPLPDLLAAVTLGHTDDQARVEAVARVIGKLATNRLITVGRDLTTGVDYAEITHDALLRTWTQLRQWIEENRAGLVTGRQAAAAADEWAAHGKHDDDLYSGSRLDVARDWAAQGGYIPPLVSEFLDRGDAARRARELAERRRHRRNRTLLYTFGVLALVLATLATLTFVSLTSSRRDNAQLQSEQIAAEANSLFGTNPALARDLALAAYHESPTDAAAQAVINASITPTDATLAVPGVALSTVFSPDGAVLAVGGNRSDGAGTVSLWQNFGAPAKVATLPLAHTCALTVMPTGDTLVTACHDVLSFWDISNPRQPRLTARVGTEGAPTQTVAVSPNGQWLADGTTDGIVQLWSIADLAHARLVASTRPDPNVAVHAVAFNSASTLLAIADNQRAALATLNGPAGLTNLVTIASGQTGDDAIIAVAFQPNANIVVIGDSSGSYFYDVNDPNNPKLLNAANINQNLPPLDGPVSALAFSADAGIIAGGRTDGGIELADVLRDDGSSPYTLPGSKEMLSVAISPDSGYVAGAGMDGVVHVWPIASHPAEVQSFALGEATGAGTMVSDDDRLLVSQIPTSQTAGLVLWDISDRQHPVRTFMFPGNWNYGEFLAGHVLATENRDATQVQLWDLGKPGAPVPLGGPVLTAPGGLTWAVNPAGNLLAGYDQDTTKITVWNVANPRKPALQATIDASQAYDNPATLVQFLGNTAVAMENNDDTGMLRWDVSRPGASAALGTVRFTEPGNTNAEAASAPGCPVFATHSSGNPIQLWTGVNQPAAAGGKPIVVPNLTGSSEVPMALTSGCLLVEGTTNNADSEITVWNVGNAKAPIRIASIPASGLVQSIAVNDDASMIAAASTPPQNVSLGQTSTTSIFSRADDGSYHQVAALSSTNDVESTMTFLPHSDELVYNPAYQGSVSNAILSDIVDPEPAKIAQRLCATTQRALTRDSWQQTFPDDQITYQPPC
jgi:WD40 repeat protein